MTESQRRFAHSPVLRGPVLPLRDIVVFPRMVVPLFVGREKSVAALEEAMRQDKRLLLVTQKDAKINSPTAEDLFSYGCVGKVLQLLRLPDGTVKVLIEGRTRAQILHFVDNDDYLCVEYELVPDKVPDSLEAEALMREVKATFEEYVKLNKQMQPDVLSSVLGLDDAGMLADTVVVHLQSAKIEDRQALLEEPDAQERLTQIYDLLRGEIEILEVERRIRTRVKRQMARSQKEYYLNEQMQAIQRELGEKDEFRAELIELEKQIKSKPAISEEALDKAHKELKKLQMMSPMSSEATVIRNYLDWISMLPWGVKSEENFDLKEAENVLEADHFGLEKIKERILEHLAVQALSKKLTGPVLCFVGPPGTGKTSLARSVARATGREFVRLSLGGVRDEAEIRGHRRTYIGALPGKIIQSLKKAGTDNPVFLLDEIDKMSSDFRGDPASALLEVLDPEQNHVFNDHYLDLDYDLSDVMFITTANLLSGIPLPLQDRMEIIELSSYTEYEKLHIAQRYLVPRQREKCGLEADDVRFDDSAVETLVHRYTKEAGVRNLEREIASVLRKAARRKVTGALTPPLVVTPEVVRDYLGPEKFRPNERESENRVGLVNGLAVTSVGGDLLHVEVAVVPGKGKLIRTGRMGEVMQEASEAALTYVRSRAEVLGIDPEFLGSNDIHVHFPEGAVPKDGPSAGIATATCIVSALAGIPVDADMAMTGEITLRGRVLAIGGVKEKLLAAHRAQIHRVILPRENLKDLHDVPQVVLESLELAFVEHMDQVLGLALLDDTLAERFSTERVMRYRKGRPVALANAQERPAVQ